MTCSLTNLWFPLILASTYGFEGKDMVSGVNNAKSSVQRAVRTRVLQDYPEAEDFIDQILPKKETLKIVKCHEHIELLAGPSGKVLFFRSRDGPYVPTLQLVHKFPFMLPWMQVDKGAIRFVLSGANIMCPGLTSPGAKMTRDLPAETIVALMAEGKQHALAVGLTKLSTNEILEKNKGVGIENLHYLNDGLWTMKPVK